MGWRELLDQIPQEKEEKEEKECRIAPKSDPGVASNSDPPGLAVTGSGCR
jgi:hypothetical protein